MSVAAAVLLLLSTCAKKGILNLCFLLLSNSMLDSKLTEQASLAKIFHSSQWGVFRQPLWTHWAGFHIFQSGPFCFIFFLLRLDCITCQVFFVFFFFFLGVVYYFYQFSFITEYQCNSRPLLQCVDLGNALHFLVPL